MPRFLTFDLGTTLYKVALFDDAGNLLGVERTAPTVLRPHPGWAQVDPGEFLRLLADACGRLRHRTGGDWSDVVAASFATQANSFSVDRDEGGDDMIDLILWTDQRAAPLAEELEQIARLPDFRRRTGMPRFGAALALAKVLWLRRQGPSPLWGRRQLRFISDFLTASLTGTEETLPRAVTEAGVAGLSGALDIRTLEWLPDVLEKVELPPIEMPSVVRAGTKLGPTQWLWARAFGLPRACEFVAGCLDQYAGAIGTGTVTPGQVCETTGTVLAAVRVADRLNDDPAAGVYQGPAFSPERFFQMSFSSTSANLLEHYRNSLSDKPAFDELTRLAAEADDAVTIEPYREGVPIEECFRHVRPEHTRGQLVRGIMRCVALALKEQVTALCGSDAMPPEIRAAGGGARSDLWLQMKADLLDVPFVALECEEPTSLGAAILAAHGVGMGSVEELAAKWVRPRATFSPQRRPKRR